MVVKSRLQIDIGTYLSVPKLNLKDRKVAIDASCACKKNKGHKGTYVEKDNSLVYISG